MFLLPPRVRDLFERRPKGLIRRAFSKDELLVRKVREMAVSQRRAEQEVYDDIIESGMKVLSDKDKYEDIWTSLSPREQEVTALTCLGYRSYEIAGVAVLAVGSLWALATAGLGVLRGGRRSVYEQTRQHVGRSILLGLEILIIADIVQTITIDPTLESAATLGVIVLVRTFLSFSLEIELEGVVPWRRRSAASPNGSGS
jgi:uncharacterized membrane protein